MLLLLLRKLLTGVLPPTPPRPGALSARVTHVQRCSATVTHTARFTATVRSEPLS